MNQIKLTGKVTLAELQRQIDELEEQLENLPTKYPETKRWYRHYEDEEFTH